MSDSAQPHAFDPAHPERVSSADVLFNCPSCKKSLIVDGIAAGHSLPCPNCGVEITVPQPNRVVTLAEAPETAALDAKPAWERELLGIEASIKESRHQREEASNFYKQHLSEANRQQIRIERLDRRLRELAERAAALRAQHLPPPPKA
ncbi:MAG: hypothetical protein HUU04_09475 [Verrucomicrobiae bacterium]|nr:hypothetical protein [Verrucomicrobiae bacterium]